jgi:Ca2+-binding EF-hand superfamily protein
MMLEWGKFCRNQQPAPSTVGANASLRTSNQNQIMKTKYQNSIVAACALALCALPPAHAGPDGDKHFKMMDANGDGKITRAEHATAAKQMFAQCDANQDGTVTAAEMDTAMASLGEKPGKGDLSSAEKIKMIDKNGDGKLTAAEHNAGSEEMFGKMDTNSDGVLSKDECDAAKKMFKKDKTTS